MLRDDLTNTHSWCYDKSKTMASFPVLWRGMSRSQGADAKAVTFRMSSVNELICEAKLVRRWIDELKKTCSNALTHYS